MTSRKNQTVLAADTWATFINALNQTHGIGASAPAYRTFLKVHVRAMNPLDPEGMSWGVHTMGFNMRGRNFLAWHRQFLLAFEQRLQQVDASVALPYWDWLAQPAIPDALSDSAFLTTWGITRNWDPTQMPQPDEVDAIMGLHDFDAFQSALEAGPHADVHNAIGGDMATSSSPSDPIFWLHHANVDRLWAAWEANNPGQNPANADEVLQPPPLFANTVGSVLNISAPALDYRYE